MTSIEDMPRTETNSEQLTLLPQTTYLLSCMTTLRSADTDSSLFASIFDNVAVQLIGAALSLVPSSTRHVTTPTGHTYAGCVVDRPICGVSILRAGASFEAALRTCCRGPLSFGTILVQRDEETSLPTHMYSKLPGGISSKSVFVLEPMLATGGSACKAISILEQAGVLQENIVFVNLVTSRRGLARVLGEFPGLRLVTAAIDDEMTASNHIAPGLGDFGDRFYGTV